MNQTLKLMLHPKEYKAKPNDAGRITNAIIHHPKQMKPEELASEIVSGKTFMCSYLDKNERGQVRRNESHWKSQQVVALDFDNESKVKNEDGKMVNVKDVTMTLEDALEDKFIKKNAAFIYTTFSHTKDHPKFRVVFIFDKPFYNLIQCKQAIEKLLDMYPMADQSCKDGSRLFYGGRELHIIDYNNRLKNNYTLWEDIKGLYLLYPTKGSSSSSSNITLNINNSNQLNNKPLNKPLNKPNKSTNTYQPIKYDNKLASNIQLIKQRNIHSLHKGINPKPITLHNNNQVYDYLKKQDLKCFLGVHSNSIYDIFHDEDKPSGSIYKSEKGNGHWLYKCHSTSYPFAGTIIQIVEKLLNCSMVEAKDFLMKVYKVEIKENEAQKLLKEEIDAYKYILQSEELQDLYPSFYKLFSRYGYLDNLYILLDLVKENLPANSDDPRLLFYYSINTIAERFMRSPTNTSIRMNFFTFFKLIYKLSDKEVPKNLLTLHLNYQRQKNYKYRNNIYEMKLYSYDFFAELDKRCEDWNSKGLTTKTMNYEGILRNYGREEANRVFPQDQDKEIPELHKDVVSMLERTALNLINAKGWTTEKEIIEELKLYFKGQKKLKENLIKRCIGEMLVKYDLERISSNKKIKEEMGITEEQLSPASFPKLIRSASR
ncbi:hypothetical protein [Bacillus norwichensis]|uniref:DNA primase n=1 Tax=Bacillus norwichensis TaxID=2762217 RepID=A0ABR8VJH5_9BACI|nr:hypothetical protein [Bacillus norwichensis]MBD8004551.1 hypothetical protein [Bacillus norwichensis]